MSETLTKMNANRQNLLALLSRAQLLWPTNLNCNWRKRVTKHDIEWQCFQNWSTKDKIETSIRTFQSVLFEIKNTFVKIEWRGDEDGRENLYYFDGMILSFKWSLIDWTYPRKILLILLNLQLDVRLNLWCDCEICGALNASLQYLWIVNVGKTTFGCHSVFQKALFITF